MKNTYFMSKKVMNERQFSDLIYKMVNESLDALSGYNFEANDNANDNNGQNDDSKRRNNRRRQQVEAFFKQPGVNPAAYAYRLYRVKPVEGDDTNDMKNARSKFMKCLNHEKNEDGYEYAFDSSEVNTLFSMISGNELKENKISLSESDIMYMVNESVNRILKEAYPTMSQKDSDDISSLENNIFTDEYNPPQNNLSFGMIAKLIGDAYSKLEDYDVVQAIDNDGNYEMEINYNNYLKSLEKHLGFCLSLCEKIVKQEIMLKGQQPDKYYDYKHSKSDGIRKHHEFWNLPRKNSAN